MIRFGKSSRGLAEIKNDFFENNAALLEDARAQAVTYRQQPRREACKNCDQSLRGTKFEQHLVEYMICERCEHLNGAYQDTDEFCEAIYVADGGESFAGSYREIDAAALEQRLSFVYRPKRDFLFDALREADYDPAQLKYSELGSGSGYFLKTLSEAGVEDFVGHEVAATQVEFAKSLVGEAHIRHHGLGDNLDIIADLTCEVLVMLGVLEHIQNPREILDAIRKNNNIKFLFLVVPTFSPSVYFEASFENIMPRVLTGGHTHLYTNRSLHWIAEEFELTRVAEWWFGTDIFDLFRSVGITLSSGDRKTELSSLWGEMFPDVIDDLQLVLDKRRLSSQAHILFSV
mgnify:FL=1